MADIKVIAILVDDPNSWFVSYALKLKDSLLERGYIADLYHSCKEIPSVDVCFMLSCTKIVKKNFLDRNRHNIVVHASDLPKGKGFTPMKWQILEGKNDIPLTLFEAVEACDAGPYYIKDNVRYMGHEMLPDLQDIMANKIIEMCLLFVNDYANMHPIDQTGDSTFYPRFKADDDFLDVNKTLAEHFNHFRIADNDRFPLQFEYRGHHYKIIVSKVR